MSLSDRIMQFAWSRVEQESARAKRYRQRAFAAARSAKLYRKLWNMQLRGCEAQKKKIAELRAELNVSEKESIEREIQLRGAFASERAAYTKRIVCVPRADGGVE